MPVITDVMSRVALMRGHAYAPTLAIAGLLARQTGKGATPAHADAVTVLYLVREVDGDAVSEDHFYLGVGHPAGLDHVFDAAGNVKGA